MTCANVDFKPGVFSALKYATKYAMKQEKGSKAFDKMMAECRVLGGLSGGGELLKPHVETVFLV